MYIRHAFVRSMHLLFLMACLACSGCYRFTFQQHAPVPASSAGPPTLAASREVTYVKRVPTWLNGFIGTGVLDTTRYCEKPLRTELRVTAIDVLLSVATLLIYTPHTLSVTCEVLDEPAALMP